MKDLEKLQELAVQHSSLCGNSSAVSCLLSGINCIECEYEEAARRWFIRSLSHSIGICHPDYAKAWELAGYPEPITASPPLK